MDVHTLIDRASRGERPNVALIVGSERLFIDRAVAALRKASVGQGDSWNEDVFNGKQTSAARILDAARTLPMLGGTRFVLVRAVDDLADKELDGLTAYLNSPVDSSCLVLTAEKLDGRSKFSKTAKQLGYLVEAQPFKIGQMREFFLREAQRRQLKLHDDAAAAMVDALGTDLSAADDALERLSLYVGPDQPITLQAVEACVSRVRVDTIWALVDAVSLRDRRVAMKAASSLLRDREPPLRILAMLARQIRIVARMRDALAGGMSPQEATAAAGAPPFKARELGNAARRFGPNELSRAFRVLAEADLMQKGGKTPPAIALENAILELTRASQ
ncbi:MAG TPA: DNA polymerase III subunit delta [Polyangiales bacterium]|nr:DNA polymerase III subunit delta [Polyangiales bacterium]